MKMITWKQFGIFVLLLIGIILAFSPVNQGTRSNEFAVEIAKQIMSKEDHISAEELGHMIIDGDPDFIVIDVRSQEEYMSFHIEPSVNIPLETLLKPETLDEIDNEKLIILYSNGGTHAAQGWVLLQQEGFKNSAVLLGGLNYWVDVYTNPEPPTGHYADHDMFNYQFLKSAGSNLMGNSQSIESTSKVKKPVNLKPRTRKKKKKAADDGC
ncbi:MAG: rhodanese-like domain-containing protein [Calditrichia bacterium]|nr:rhodanese-like domain-containing protein [Calditrichia bacterium]